MSILKKNKVNKNIQHNYRLQKHNKLLSSQTMICFEFILLTFDLKHSFL